MQTDKLDAWLQTYVNNEQFTVNLQKAIESIDKPEVKARYLLELVEYLKPKVKNIEAPPQTDKEIIVNFLEALKHVIKE